jgi:hypothetical protein
VAAGAYILLGRDLLDFGFACLLGNALRAHQFELDGGLLDRLIFQGRSFGRKLFGFEQAMVNPAAGPDVP